MNRNLVLVAASLFAWGIGEGLFIYFQPLYLQEWGADPILIGAVFSAMGIAMAISPIPAGYLSDRFGPRTIMWISWILGTIAAWCMALAGSMSVFIIGLVLYGLTGFVVAPMASYITNSRGKLSIGRALTFTSGMYNLGAVLGPVSGGFIADRLGLQTVYIIAAVIFIVSTIMVFFISKDTTHQHPDDSGSNKIGLLKNSRFLAFLLIVLVTFLILYLPQPFTPSFLQNQQGFSRSMIGILGAFGSLGNAVAMLALGHLKPVTGFIIGQIWVLLYVTLFLVGDLPFWFGLGYFFFGGYRLCRSMVLAIARPLVHPRQTGLAYGMIETAAAVSVIAAPILAGFLYKADPYSLYRVAVILCAGLILFSLFIFKILIGRRNKQDAPRP